MAHALLHLLDADNYLAGVANVLKKEVKKGDATVYVTTSKPFSVVAPALRKAGLNAANIFFIDCVSKQAGGASETSNCVFLDGVQNMSDVSIAISDSLKGMKGDRTLVFDSLSTLLLYNDANAVGRFSNHLINRMRAQGVRTHLLALKGDLEDDTVKKIKIFVDEVRRR